MEGTSGANTSSGRPWRGALAFALLGAGLLALLIVHADPTKLWRALERGAGWVPVLVALEGLRIVIEAWGGRNLYARQIPYVLLLRANLAAYPVVALAPAGRATSEGVKARMLRRYTRLTDTAAAATTIQTCSLLALGLWSLVCMIVALGVSLRLAGAFALQAAVVVAGAALVRGVARTSVLGRLLGRLSPRARDTLEEVRRGARRHRLGEPLAAFVLSRGLELGQYSLILFAVTRHFTLVLALLTFGVATLAGSLGESIPGQLGVIGGTFFAAAMVLGISKEDALAFALLAHGFQIVWIAVGLLTPIAWRVRPSPSR